MSGADGPTPDIEETPLPQKGLTSLSAPQSARLIGRGVPVGPAVWREDAVLLLAGDGDRVYRNLFTGEIVETTEREGRRTLPLAAVFSRFPVMLERVGGA